MNQKKILLSRSDGYRKAAMIFGLIVISILAVIFSTLSYTGPYGQTGLIFFLLSSALMAFVSSFIGNYCVLLIFLISPVLVAVTLRPSLAIWPFFSIVLAASVVVMKKKSKSATVLVCSAVILCGALCSFAGEAAYSGEITLSSVASQITQPFDSMRDFIVETCEQMVNNGYEEYRIDSELIDDLFMQTALYSPAIAACTAMISAWFTTTLWSGLNKRFNKKEYIADWHIEANTVSAVVYIIAFVAVFVCSSFETDIMTVFGIAFSNLSVMLTPCFAAVGFRCGTARLKASPFRNIYFACIVFSALLLVFSPSICISVYSVIGLVDTFRKNRFEGKK